MEAGVRHYGRMKMNPFSLLTKGETVKGLKSRSRSYKMLDKNPLPNFSVPRHPSPATPQAEPCTGRQALLEQPEPAAELPVVERVELPVTPCNAAVPAASAGGVSPLGKAPDGTPAELAAGTAALQKPSKPGPWSRLWRITAGWLRTWLPRRKAAFGGRTCPNRTGLG